MGASITQAGNKRVGARGESVVFLADFNFFYFTPLRNEKIFDMIQHAGRRGELLLRFFTGKNKENTNEKTINNAFSGSARNRRIR